MEDQARRTDSDMPVTPRGSHFCFVYRNLAEMAAFLQDYFMSGLESNELCVWMTPDVESTAKAKDVLQEKGIYIDPYIRNSQLEILPVPELPGNDMALLPTLLLDHWKLMHEHAVLNGFDGLRFNVDLKDIEGSCLDLIRSYNDTVKNTVREIGMRSICTCPLRSFTPSEVLEMNTVDDDFIIKADDKGFSLRESEVESSLTSTPESTLEDKQDVLGRGKARQKKEELASIYESSPAIAFLWKAEKGFPVEYVSDNVAQLGYYAEELMSHEVLYADIIHPADVEGYYSDLLACLKEGRMAFSREYRILDKSGNVHWISEHSQIEVDENGLSDRYHGIIMDITDKKSAEGGFKDPLVNYKAVLDGFCDAFYVQDADGNLLDVNRSGLEISGYSREELLSLNSAYLIDPDHAGEFKGHMADVPDKGSLTFESVIVKKDASSIPVEINASTVKYAGKDSVLIAMKDITERRNKEENLSAVKASAENGSIAKCEFLSNMTHELRTPLNAIIGFSDILLDESDVLGERHLKYVRNISDSGKKLLGIINDVLDISRLEAGNVELHSEHFLVWESFDIVSSSLARMAEKKSVDLHCELDPRGIVINADKQKFEQILQNMMDNAIKFTPDGGSVDLSGRFVNDRLVVQVKDTGIGIPEEDCKSLFDSFTQADGSYRRGYGGNGLGLAIVKHYVEMHGGNVWVKSKPGVGSTFSFDIPIETSSPNIIRSASQAPVSENMVDLNLEADADSIPSDVSYDAAVNGAIVNIAPAPSIGRSGEYSTPEIIVPDNCTDADPLVLVIEDDETSRELLMLAFIDGGYRVVAAEDGLEGLALARKLKPFAITLDIMLPKMDGWELLSQLKADVSTSAIPVLVISMLDQKETALELGASEYLAKPFDRDDLLKLMDRYRNKLEGKSPKILLVDDEPYAVDLLSSMLESEGFTTLSAYSGMDAIDMCTADQPDMVIIDLMMPDITGFDVISTIRSNPVTGNIPIVVCTGKELSPDDRLLLDDKVDSVMEKGDFSKKDLLDTVHRLVSDGMSK
ncbi:response regulator [Methanococcoides cohabitans]|uniref:histidine kinase n=1 Tax=Methanococcoides cohabitans TaxID=3136559 RepID=A0ABU9KT40_9EURY